MSVIYNKALVLTSGARQTQRLPRLHHVTVQVPPRLVGACLDFYRSVLGLHSVMTPIQKTAWFEQGIHLYWGDSDYCEPINPEPQHFALVLGDSYDKAVEICKKLGLFIEEGTSYWGSPRCYIKDPAGNRIEAMQSPPGNATA